jgi:hypothetical protein
MSELEQVLAEIKEATKPRSDFSDECRYYRSISFSYQWDGTIECEVDAAGADPVRGYAIIEEAEGTTELEAAQLLLEKINRR